MIDSCSNAPQPAPMQLDIDKAMEALSKDSGETRNHTRCKCGKLMDDLEDMRIRFSGVVNYRTPICTECLALIPTHCHIVCLKCKSLATALPPGKDSVGFVFEKSTCYHVSGCPTCEPDNLVTPILEHLRYCRSNGIPSNADADIVQEIEQKRKDKREKADKKMDKIKEALEAPKPNTK